MGIPVNYPTRLQLTVAIVLAASELASSAESPKYRLVDPQLKVVHIDSSPTESFLSMRADATGRLFVGGREALFVYEPIKKGPNENVPNEQGPGGYGPRQQLYRFPKDSWVYDIEIRGNDLYVLTLSALYLFPDGVTQRSDVGPMAATCRSSQAARETAAAWYLTLAGTCSPTTTITKVCRRNTFRDD